MPELLLNIEVSILAGGRWLVVVVVLVILVLVFVGCWMRRKRGIVEEGVG